MNRDLEESEVCTDENQRFGDSLSENREAPTGDSCKYKRHSTSVQTLCSVNDEIGRDEVN